MLELIFQGFAEWLYGLTLECWQYFSSALLDIMSLDFAYIKTHIPVVNDIMQVLLAVGWALLLGNLVFQAARSMLSGLGFEAEDPKLLFARTFVFAFLLLASPQICELGLDLTSNIMALLEVPDAVNVQLVDDSVFGGLTAAWLLVIIFDVIIMFKVLKLLLEVAERYVILAMLTITAPLAFATGGSRSTSDIFSGWCRMYGSMCLLMCTNVIFFKMLLSVVSTVPSGLDVFPWMVLILAIVKVAKKADAIITRIGLNPAITGDSLGSRLPGMLTYAVARTAVSNITKTIGKSVGGTGKSGTSGPSPRGGGPKTGGPFGGGHGAAFTGSAGSTGGTSSTGPAAGRDTYTQQSAAVQQGAEAKAHTQQGGSTQRATQQGQTIQHTAAQKGGQQPVTQQASTQEQSTSFAHISGGQVRQNGPTAGQQARKSSVPLGTRRAPSHVRLTTAAPGGRAPGAPIYGAAPSRGPGPDRQGASVSQIEKADSTISTARISQTTGRYVQGGPARSGVQEAAEASGLSKPLGPQTSRQPGGKTPGPGPGTAEKGGSGRGAASVHTETRSTRRTSVTAAQGKGAPAAPGSSGQPVTAGTGAPGVKGVPGQEPRQGRNGAPAAPAMPSPTRERSSPARQEGRPPAPSAGASSIREGSGPARQESQMPPARTSPVIIRDGSSPARQEPRAPSAAEPPTGKGTASTHRPGRAGRAAEAPKAEKQPPAAQGHRPRGQVTPPPVGGSTAKKLTSARKTAPKPPKRDGGSGHGG